jgi:hypothetical protein
LTVVCVPIGQVDPALFSVVSLALRPQSKGLGAPSTTRAARRSDDSRIQEYSDFEKQFGIPPGSYLDAESETALRKADEEEQLRERYTMPEPPAGVRVGSPAFRVYREEVYQAMRLQLGDMHHRLRDYYEQKRQEGEKLKKEMMSAIRAPERRADSA